MVKQLGEHGNKVLAWRSPNSPAPAQDEALQPLVTAVGQAGQGSAQAHLGLTELSPLLGISWPGLSKFSQSQSQRVCEPPAVTSCSAMAYLGSGTSLFSIIIVMDLIVDGEIFPKRVFPEEEAGPSVGNDHRPPQKVLVLQGEAKHHKTLLLQGVWQRICWREWRFCFNFYPSFPGIQRTKEKSHISRHHSVQESSALDLMGQGVFPAWVYLNSPVNIFKAEKFLGAFALSFRSRTGGKMDFPIPQLSMYCPQCSAVRPWALGARGLCENLGFS